MTGATSRYDTVVLDIDGTLVDSNYHHVLAWHRAFRDVGEEVPCWRIHRSIGMGGDRLVGAAAGNDVEHRLGDRVRAAWESEYDELLHEPVAFPGARELLAALRDRDLKVVLASSSIPRHARRVLELLEAEALVDAATTSEDAEESKPDPELVELAIDRVDGTSSLLIGDSVWDVVAAKRVGIPIVAVECGGFSEAELRGAGAARVFPSVTDLLGDLDTVLSGR